MSIEAIANDVLLVVMFVLQCDLNIMIKSSELLQRFGDLSLPSTLFLKKGFKLQSCVYDPQPARIHYPIFLTREYFLWLSLDPPGALDN